MGRGHDGSTFAFAFMRQVCTNLSGKVKALCKLLRALIQCVFLFSKSFSFDTMDFMDSG